MTYLQWDSTRPGSVHSTTLTTLRLVSALAALLVASGPAAAQTSRLQPTDLEYKGAFRLPEGQVGASTWGYGGWALTFYPGGDPSGPNDGYPGSLYGVGHDWDQLVSEVSIPAPVISPGRNENDLPIAKTLQSFADVSGGKINQVSADKLGGLAYLPAQGGQSTEKLYWTVYEYYRSLC